MCDPRCDEIHISDASGSRSILPRYIPSACKGRSMENMTFTELKLSAPLLKAIQAEGYERPTPIQAQAIPHLIEGRDLIGCAQTGTGKTAAFALPMLNRLSLDRRRVEPRCTRALILTPTRELAAQVGESFKSYGKFTGLKHALVFGGVNQGFQVKSISRGVDILVATPGRLLDLINQRHIFLKDVEMFVLDEADRMLDMGFMPDIKKIIAMIPKKRQTLLFSATMAPEIKRLAEGLLTDPINITVAPPASPIETIDQRVLFVDETNKRALLSEIVKSPDTNRMLVFTRTKHGADRLVKQLGQNAVLARAIHGNKSQSARTAALEDFRRGKFMILVATDIAARGIDVDNISHVINFDLPNEAESYVHRIGRTARAGKKGTALSFCSASERGYLKDIERLIKRAIPIDMANPFHCEAAATSNSKSAGKRYGVSPRNQNNPNRKGKTGFKSGKWSKPRNDRRGPTPNRAAIAN